MPDVNRVYANYIDLYSDKTTQYNQWLNSRDNIHWSRYVDANPDLRAAWEQANNVSPISKWDWGANHYSQSGRTEARVLPKVIDTLGLPDVPGEGGREDYVVIYTQTEDGGNIIPDENVKSQFGHYDWEERGAKREGRILPGIKFYLDSENNLRLLERTDDNIQTIGDDLVGVYRGIANRVNNASPEDYKRIMEDVGELLPDISFRDLTQNGGDLYGGGLGVISGALTTKIPVWDRATQGAQPPLGAFDPSYYSTQTDLGREARAEWDTYLQGGENAVNVNGFRFDNATYTRQYGNPDGYLHWNYTTQGLPNRVRGNRAERALAVEEYQEYLTDAERQMYRDQVLGLAPAFETITEWAAAQDPEVLERWYEMLPTDQREQYDQRTLPVPTLDYIPEELRDEVIMTRGTTVLEGELTGIVTERDIQQQRMFGSLSQDSLKKSAAELQRATAQEQLLDFYFGFEGVGEIGNINEELRNSILGDTGIGGILAWMGSPDDIGSSLEETLSNITGIPSRNNTIYNWQRWFDEQFLPNYEEGTTIVDTLDPDITYEIPVEFAADYIDRYLRPRFDNSKSMSEFVSYMDVKQNEQNIFQTQSALARLKDLADIRAEAYLDSIYRTTNPGQGGTALVFDPEFYWNPTGNFTEDDPKRARYELQRETVAEDWEIAKNQGNTATPEGEPYTWNQLAYLYGLDINDRQQFANLHYQVKGHKTEYNFDPAQDVITLQTATDYIRSSILPEIEAERLELGDITFLDFVTPEEFADAVLEGISPEEHREEWERLLERLNLGGSDMGLTEVRDFLISTLRTGAAQEIRESIKYLNEKKIRPTQKRLGLQYIAREEDYQPTDSPTDTPLYRFFQQAGYRGTEEDFYRDFMPDADPSEMQLLNPNSRLQPGNLFSDLSSNDPLAAFSSLESLFGDEEDDETESEQDSQRSRSYFRLFEDDQEERQSFSRSGRGFLDEFTSLFRGFS